MSYKVHHVFPETGEWAQVEVDTLCDAVMWWNCKTKARNELTTVVTLYGPNNQVMRQVTL